MKKEKEDNEKAKETIRLNKLKRASKTNNKKRIEQSKIKEGSTPYLTVRAIVPTLR